jgi:hypothetical protein
MTEWDRLRQTSEVQGMLRRDRLRERVGHLVYLMNEWRRAETRTFDESLAIGPVLHADHLADQVRATLYQLLEIE